MKEMYHFTTIYNKAPLFCIFSQFQINKESKAACLQYHNSSRKVIWILLVEVSVHLPLQPLSTEIQYVCTKFVFKESYDSLLSIEILDPRNLYTNFMEANHEYLRIRLLKPSLFFYSSI